MKRKNNTYASDFWLDDVYGQYGIKDLDNEVKSNGPDLMEMASYRRAVSNFVRIVSNKDIPVRFSTGNDSYTNGKEVTISASTKIQDRDSQVGLALHEGSHCILTNFEFLKEYVVLFKYSHNPESIDKQIRWAKELEIRNGRPNKLWSSDHISRISKWSPSDITTWLQQPFADMVNVIEDRRIDDYIKRTAPGYRPYYEALYDKYFNSKVISKGLQSCEYRNEDWESYLFRILNLLNPNSDLDALSKLREIHDHIDIKNINRLKSTEDAAVLAFDIICMIRDACNAKATKNKPSASTDTENNSPSAPAGSGSEGPDIDNHDLAPDNTPEDDEPIMSDLPQLKPSDKLSLDKKIKEQLALSQGTVKKQKVSNKIHDQLEALTDSNVETNDVVYDGKPVKTIVVHKLTKKLINNVSCGMWTRNPRPYHERAVNDGLRKGVILGKRLKLRSEEKSTKYNRLRSGRIDKRMIASAGYDNEALFTRLETFAYKPGIIHISIDNSGSMWGDKFNKCLETSSAIAKACSMSGNLDCIISFRSSDNELTGSREALPMIVIAYDSRTQNISELRALLPHMETCGSTPEGLCFNTIMRSILKSSAGKDAFFLNFSDGAPGFSMSCKTSGGGRGWINYSGESAYKHTNKQIVEMRNNNINVISYFIGSDSMFRDGKLQEDRGDVKCFRTMYGTDAQFIDTQDIFKVARSINNKFLEVK